MAWMLGKKKAPLTSPLTKVIDQQIYRVFNPRPSDEQTKAEAEIKAGGEKSVLMPGVDDPNVMEAAKLEEERARKRRGRASTLMAGEDGAPMTTSETLLGPY